MKPLITTNIYEPKGAVLIAGTCLPDMQKNGFLKLQAQADCVYSLCLEESHINTAVTKLGAMLSTGQITKLMFATVDRSPHCTKVHYIDHELRRMMEIAIPMEHSVLSDEQIYPISAETIERSKTLHTL